MKRPQKRVQYRYYETPPDSHVLALLGTGWIREYGNDLDELHFHNCLEIGYCHDGEGTMAFGDRIIPYKKGMFTVIPPKFIHHTNSLPGEKCSWEFLFVNLDSCLIKLIPNRDYARAQFARKITKDAVLLKHGDNPQIANLILAIMDEHREKSYLYNESVRGLLQSLLICIARLCGDNLAGTNTDRQTCTITAGIDYVTTHYNEKVTVSMLADACHMSESNFRRVFLQTMHISPLAYINRVRVEAACYLLRTTNEAIGDIAVRCGFISITALNRNFKCIVGMSPKEWRKDSQSFEWKLGNSNILPYEGWR